MTKPTDTRDGQLGVYLALSSPTRVAIIDALAVRKRMSDKEIGAWLVATGDLAREAVPNLTRVHLAQLEDVELIEKFVDSDKQVRYRIGPSLEGGISYEVDADDVELAGAKAEFGRVLTERRLTRQRFFESRKSEYPRGLVAVATTTDNVDSYTQDEMDWAAERLHALSSELSERAARRRSEHPDAEEFPCFQTFNIFPWGPPPGVTGS